MDLRNFGKAGEAILSRHASRVADKQNQHETERTESSTRNEGMRPTRMAGTLLCLGYLPQDYDGIRQRETATFPLKPSASGDLCTQLAVTRLGHDFTLGLQLRSASNGRTVISDHRLGSIRGELVNIPGGTYGFCAPELPDGLETPVANDSDVAQLMLKALEEAHELAFPDETTLEGRIRVAILSV